MGWIIFPASQGQHSHFNDRTAFHRAMFSVMGFAAVIITHDVHRLVAVHWRFARRSHSSDSYDASRSDRGQGKDWVPCSLWPSAFCCPGGAAWTLAEFSVALSGGPAFVLRLEL
jgi:hypothetical protein